MTLSPGAGPSRPHGCPLNASVLIMDTPHHIFSSLQCIGLIWGIEILTFGESEDSDQCTVDECET